MFVKKFEILMKEMDNQHLKYFYMLVPALTINFIKDLAISKEKL